MNKAKSRVAKANTARLLSSNWPSRKITRFRRKNKATRFAYLECGHRRSVDNSSRESVRCYRCSTEGPRRKVARPRRRAVAA